MVRIYIGEDKLMDFVLMFIVNVHWLTNALQLYFLFEVTKIKVYSSTPTWKQSCVLFTDITDMHDKL